MSLRSEASSASTIFSMRGLAFRAEGGIHVGLAQRFTQSVVRGVDAALPAHRQFFLPGDGLLELEIFLHKVV